MNGPRRYFTRQAEQMQQFGSSSGSGLVTDTVREYFVDESIDGEFNFLDHDQVPESLREMFNRGPPRRNSNYDSLGQQHDGSQMMSSRRSSAVYTVNDVTNSSFGSNSTSEPPYQTVFDDSPPPVSNYSGTEFSNYDDPNYHHSRYQTDSSSRLDDSYSRDSNNVTDTSIHHGNNITRFTKATIMKADKFIQIFQPEIEAYKSDPPKNGDENKMILSELLTDDGLKDFCVRMVNCLDDFCRNMQTGLQRQKYLELIQNLRRLNNRQLRLKVLSGELTIEQLIRADTKDLAPESLKRKREEESIKYFQEQVLLKTSSAPLVRKTHKGLETIQDAESGSAILSETVVTGTTQPLNSNGRVSEGGGIRDDLGRENSDDMDYLDDSTANQPVSMLDLKWNGTTNFPWVTDNSIYETENENDDQILAPIISIGFPKWIDLLDSAARAKLGIKTRDILPDTRAVNVSFVVNRLQQKLRTLESMGLDVSDLQNKFQTHSECLINALRDGSGHDLISPFLQRAV